MALHSTAEEMEHLQLSEEDTEDLWDSPSKRGKKKSTRKQIKQESSPVEPRPDRDEETLFDRQEAREAALRHELQSVRNINEVIESLLGSLDRAKGNMEHQTVSRTVNSASTLLNTWTRILSQTEHNQRLILNSNWQGAVQDVADMENEELLKQQAAERRERELQQQREAAARKAEEEDRKRAQSTNTQYFLLRNQHQQNEEYHDIIHIQRETVYYNHYKETSAKPSPPARQRDRDKSPAVRSPRNSPPVPGFTSAGGLPSPNQFASQGHIDTSGHGNTGFGQDVEGGRWNLGAFETSLPIRMDVEAMLAYLLLPPAGGVFLLLLEHKSDYVRFHAWQSSMLFTAIFIIHLLFAWSSFISWLLFICDLALIAFLSMRAYRDVDTLDHYEVPIIGRLANSFVDNE
ncbi:hypothetical protein ARAM_001768 [Aspergillus rambellii]|uniref:DASH complex subunit duo1 n=1 Tax=Aspergillus rambellii TaxID=308745 RepID=A0A0F8WY97_9EURO|nr:hypothetical protein ARAM_001768 [Aspergillus rambellii]